MDNLKEQAKQGAAEVQNKEVNSQIGQDNRCPYCGAYPGMFKRIYLYG